MEILLDCLPASVQHTLSELPDSLDETYERILREIRKPNQRLAHRLMQCLVAAVRPLQVKELAEVLAFNFDAEGIPQLNTNWRWEDQEGAIMLACSSLVTIVEGWDSQFVRLVRFVQFSHFSVKEFLTADRLAEPMRDVSLYHIELEVAHTILAQACIGVLLGLDDRVDRDNIKDFPLARYAAEYWPQHAKFGRVSARISDGMKCLFDEDKPHFAMWLWVYEGEMAVSLSTQRPEKPGAVPLYHAARLGFHDLAAHLIVEHPEHVDGRGNWDRTAMHAAAIGGNADILSLLHEHDADVDSRDHEGGTSLHWAAYGRALGVGRCLLDHGADINARDDGGTSPLLDAAGCGDVEFVQMLLERGAVVDTRDNQNRTSLLRAMEEDYLQVARLLLEHSADVNARDEAGRTPLFWAAHKGHVKWVQMLLECGAVIDAQYNQGRSLLHEAVQDGNIQVARLLLEHSADVNARDEAGKTPLFDAACEGRIEFVQMLLECGAVIDARDNQGRSLLHEAVHYGNTQVEQLLLEHGADVNARDEAGKTPFQYPTRQEILELLSEYGFESVK